MIKFIIFILKRFAWFKRLNAKVTYELLAKKIPVKDWQFMNYGYIPDPNEPILDISLDPKIQRYPLQMYHYCALKGEVQGKNVLEVGSGRGGGANHIAGTLSPLSYIGMDLAQHAVDLAQKGNTHSNLKFVQGSAEKIPFEDNRFDVVLNVESCHAYGSVVTFLSEVRRVLKPGGKLVLVDFRNTPDMKTLKNQLQNCGLSLLEETNITENVVQAIEKEDDSKWDRIRTLIPTRWQNLFSEFAGVVGSKLHLKLKNGEKQYFRFVLQKDIP